MSKPVLLAIDQGTTSSRAIVFSPDGETLHVHQKDLKLHYPHKGWVEQNPDDIWNDTLAACASCLNYAAAQGLEVKAIGITNQRETSILWDRASGKPIYNAIVWQDRRTADHCAALKAQGHEKTITEKTGLLLDPYFSASKIAWILENVPGARAKAEAGEFAFGTVESWLIWNLTGGASHVSDATNASRTMLYNIRTHEWDEELLRLFNIPRAIMPQVQDNVSLFGITEKTILGANIPIGGAAGDQQAALIGQGCFAPGMVKSTYGTGCFALMNIGAEFKQSQNRLLTTIAYRLSGQTIYAIEGSIFVAGAAIQWLRDGLGFVESASQSEALARSVADNNDVYFVPALTGLGAPYWRPDVRGAIIGLTRESTKAHITRAALEAQGFQTYDLMRAMTQDGGFSAQVIRADGGLVANGFMCQFLADMLQKPVEIPRIHECTAWGAACLAGLYCGMFKDLEAIASRWALEKRYEPRMPETQRGPLLEGWGRAIEMLLR